VRCGLETHLGEDLQFLSDLSPKMNFPPSLYLLNVCS
jgi:hypothetical protein